jgi:hypothetical protein
VQGQTKIAAAFLVAAEIGHFLTIYFFPTNKLKCLHFCCKSMAFFYLLPMAKDQ